MQKDTGHVVIALVIAQSLFDTRSLRIAFHQGEVDEIGQSPLLFLEKRNYFLAVFVFVLDPSEALVPRQQMPRTPSDIPFDLSSIYRFGNQIIKGFAERVHKDSDTKRVGQSIAGGRACGNEVRDFGVDTYTSVPPLSERVNSACGGNTAEASISNLGSPSAAVSEGSVADDAGGDGGGNTGEASRSSSGSPSASVSEGSVVADAGGDGGGCNTSEATLSSLDSSSTTAVSEGCVFTVGSVGDGAG